MALTKITTGEITDGTITSADMAVDPTNATNLTSGAVAVGQLTTIPGANITGTIPLAALSNAPATDLTSIEADIALLGFKTQANGNLARYNLIDQSVDAFEDATGINTGTSTGELRDSTGKYYSGIVSTAITATGGTITTDGDYTIHSFIATGASTFTTDTAQSVDLLVVAGGAGGGGYCGGGGGAGGYISTIGHSVTVASHAITVGTGGGSAGGSAGGGSQGGAGGNSQFGSMTAAVGGGGGSGYLGVAAVGGSGGGGATWVVVAGTAGQGNAGGRGTGASSQGGGGGGGAGGVGGDAYQPGVSPDNYAGDGGVGISNSITGTATYYAGGGGGGRGGVATSPATAGAGGLGGGGNGSNGASPSSVTAGAANTGGGGGGGGHPHVTSAGGGTGIVILRRPTALLSYNNMSLVSNAQTAQAQPTKADVVLTYTNALGTATINTDLIASVSRDGGTTYTAVTLASQGTTGGHTILTANDVSISGQPAGTSMVWKVATTSQSVSKSTRIHAVSLGWS
jgi:hypothetical protein